MTNALQEAKEAIEAQYNSAISVYEYSDHIRFTNGSAGMYADISVEENRFLIEGERYGEKVKAACELTNAALIETLRQHY